MSNLYLPRDPRSGAYLPYDTTQKEKESGSIITDSSAKYRLAYRESAIASSVGANEADSDHRRQQQDKSISKNKNNNNADNNEKKKLEKVGTIASLSLGGRTGGDYGGGCAPVHYSDYY